MPTGLLLKQSHDGTVITLELAGPMNESSDYPSIDTPDIKTLTIDFRGITLINSIGIQKWVEFLRGVPVEVDIIFQHCTLRVVNQINLFPGFTGSRSVRITSFFAPYYCDRCDTSVSILLECLGKLGTDPGTQKLPAQRCSRCEGMLDFDGIEEKYFLFLKRFSVA